MSFDGWLALGWLVFGIGVAIYGDTNVAVTACGVSAILWKLSDE